MFRYDRPQAGVCGGGRYDGLVEACGGPPTPEIPLDGLEEVVHGARA